MNKTDKKSVIEIGLNAAIVSLEETDPHILTVLSNDESHDGLPFGPFDPLVHRTMEIGVRGFVREQTGLDVSYVEQLYTFGDRGRVAALKSGEMHVVSIGYLALTRKIDHEINNSRTGAVWRNWYRSFPWEDWRKGPPEIIEVELVPRLMKWAEKHSNITLRKRAIERVNICFGVNGSVFDEEKVLDRYELLYEAGLLFEAKRDGRQAALDWEDVPRLGEPMILDHRRIVATAMSRIRAKIKYRPVIFDLMPENFTLLDLQQSVEGISGNLLHKQNFRRLVENGGLVEPTGKVSSQTGGRPAKLFRFRKEVLLERRTAGVRVRV